MTEEQIEKSNQTRLRWAGEIVNTLEWMIIALVLAFFFRTFFMEAFRIPTGSMAETLMGAHFRQACDKCGYRYEFGLGNFDVERGYIPKEPIAKMHSRCPSCGNFQITGGDQLASDGDRILVLKCIYQFFEPKRWDVIVFKNPLNPEESFIKRLIALPGETIEIIDGDIYINGSIARKPSKVQQEMWMPIYNNDFVPVLQEDETFNSKKWQRPFLNVGDSRWFVDPNDPTLLQLKAQDLVEHRLRYGGDSANSLRANYAYNETNRLQYQPYCGDLMITFNVTAGESNSVGAAITKFGTEYIGRVELPNTMVLECSRNGIKRVLAKRSFNKRRENNFSFNNADRLLVINFAGNELTYDLDSEPQSIGESNDIEPQAEIFGTGKITLSNIAIFRDTYYTSSYYEGGSVCRGGQGNPFKLETDQFFVLGDNSPNSEDSRWWSRYGIGNGKKYREGVVPRDYLVGKAMFVYWPNGFRPTEVTRLPVVPNFGKMRFIVGGSASQRVNIN